MARNIFARAFRCLAIIAVSISLFSTTTCFAGPPSGTTRFVLDGNRVYAELTFLLPDGSLHKALAFVDMGTPSMSLNQSLFNDLQLDKTHSLTFCVGDLPVTVPASDVTSTPEPPHRLGTDLVEGILPAGVLKKYQIVLDYRKRTLSVAPPGTLTVSDI